MLWLRTREISEDRNENKRDFSWHWMSVTAIVKFRNIFLVHRRGVLLFAYHSSKLVVTWTLWTCFRCSLNWLLRRYTYVALSGRRIFAVHVSTNLHIAEQNVKILLQQRLSCLNSSLTWNPTPWNTGNYNKVCTSQWQLGTKLIKSAGQNFQNLFRNSTTGPNISAAVPAKLKYGHGRIFDSVERPRVFQPLCTT